MIDRDPAFYKNLFMALDNNSVLRKMDESGAYVPVSCTREFAEMMECTPEEFLESEYREPFSTVHPDDRDEVGYLFTHGVSRSGDNHVIVRKRTMKGNIIWTDLHYSFFEHDGVKYSYCSYFDVTKIKESEQRAESMYEGMNQQLAAVSDVSLAVIRANVTQGVIEEVRGSDIYDADRAGARMEDFFRARTENMPSKADQKRFLDLFRQDSLLERYHRGEGAASAVILTHRRSGKLAFVKYTATVRNDPATGDVLAYGIETECNAERVSELLNKKILATQYDMISYIVDGTYGVVIGSSAVKEGSIFPRKRKGVYMDYINEQVIPAASEKDHDKAELLRALSLATVAEKLADGEPYTVNVTCDIGGSSFYKRFIFYVVDREAKFYILLKVDDTEIRKAQIERNERLKSALEEAKQANVAKTSFLSAMSHEIRTPMNAIIGLGNIAMKEPDLSERTRAHLKKIDESAKHLLSLINDILDMSRIESGRMLLKNEEFSFGGMIEQINTMISSQCQAKGLSYDCVVRGKVAEYYIGDDMKLKQILINILGNAVKFTHAPGTVTFTVERVAEYDDKSTIRFMIKDTGIGMDKDFLPKLFDAFSQEDGTAASAYGGTGLGMAITKNLIGMMNGNISVESEKGKGSEFTVNITLRNSGRSSAGVDINVNELSVLVIDDDPIACEHAKLVLEEVGVAAEYALSGENALEKIRLRHARHESYDIMLVDLHMPISDGLEITKKIREIVGGELAIIILTAYSWEDVMDKAVEAGVDDFMSKPLFSNTVLKEFQKVLSQKELLRAKKQKADLAGRRILLVEDMFVNAEIMKEVLKMRGMEVEHAENGKIAVEMFASKEAGYYDAVLMDIRMPVMDGLAATSAIRALDHPDAKLTPIIAMTANAFDEDVQRSLQAGMNAHLSKPVDPDILYDTLAEFIKE